MALKQAQVAPNSGGNVGTIYAISAETGATAWKFDQRSGKVLWDINLGSPVTGYPIS